MRTTRNHYEVLGLPRDATLIQIKRRYKQLVRKYHPDVAKDKEVAHRLFIQIREAYEVLGDSARRRVYDAGLSDVGPRPTGPSQASPPANIAKHIRDAQFAFIQRRFGEAANHCRAALNINDHHPRVHAILGDIYRAQGKVNSAAKHYGFALQFDPSDRETEKKLTKLLSKRIAPDRGRKARSRVPATLLTVNMIWWGIAFFLILLIGVHPGEPIPGVGRYIPQVSLWSWNLVGLMAGASAIIGMLLSLNGLLSHPDEELVFENSGGWVMIPTGFILLIGSGFFFVGAAGFYLVVGLLQGSLSRSVLTVFAGVVGVAVLSSMVYLPEARQQVLMFGGNVSFLSMLFGWYVGSMFRPMSG